MFNISDKVRAFQFGLLLVSLAFGETASSTTLQEQQSFGTTHLAKKSEAARLPMSIVGKSWQIVFSDVDGTLIHYLDDIDSLAKSNLSRSFVVLPPSSTGLIGVLSSQTIELCRQIRDQHVKLVLVSGMRTSTLMKRLPYLPRADAYCSEAGGRIFYSQSRPTEGSIRVTSRPIKGASQQNLAPFYLSEDMEWRKRMENDNAAGKDGYERCSGKLSSQFVGEQTGALWKFAKSLEENGFVIDAQGYSTCFRVNSKQQCSNEVDFNNLMEGKLFLPKELATSINLGCVDFYPVISGKKNCCAYLANRFTDTQTSNDWVLENRCLCLCDDDNDIEMALACSHAYIPNVTSKTMAGAILKNPRKFTVITGYDSVDRTKATDEALSKILERILSDR